MFETVLTRADPSIGGSPLRTVKVWTDHESGARWVFGMHWTPTLDRRSRILLFEQMRQHGLRWCARSGSPGELIGVVPDASVGPIDRGVASAAVAFARHYPNGTHAVRLLVQGQAQWVMATHDGQVLSQTDRWFDEDAPAEALLADLRQRFPDLEVQSVSWPGFETPANWTAPPWLGPQAHARARLQRLPGGIRAQPLGTLLVLTVLVALGVWAGWSWVQSRWALHAPQLPGPTRAIDSPPKATLHAHPVAAVLEVLGQWNDLPLDPPGWALQGVSCQVLGQVARCQAVFRRLRLDTDNGVLAGFLPAGWSISAQSLNETAARLEVPMQGQPIAEIVQRQRDWMVTLQQFSQAIPFIDLGQTHRDHADGLQRVRPVALRLPFRHVHQLGAWTLPVRWLQIGLEVVPGAALDRHAGVLMLQLKGELFVSD